MKNKDRHKYKITFGGLLIWLLLSKKRKSIVKKNINIVYRTKSYKEKKNLRFAFCSYLSGLIKEFVFYSIYKKKALVEIKGKDHLINALKKDKGVLLLCPHLGNFELLLPILGENLSVYSVKLKCIRKPLSPLWLNEMIIARFKKSGVYVLSKQGASRKVVRALGQNEAIVYNLDQVTNSKHGILASFFNKKTYTHSSLAKLKNRYDAAVIPLYTYRENKNKHVINFLPEVKHNIGASVEEKTQQYNSTIEKIISQHPEQWFCWTHDRWKSDIS